MTKYLTAVVLIALIGYGLAEAWPLLAGPTLSIASPADDTAYPGGIVTVRGMAARATTLTLDGAPMLHEEDGSFRMTLSFPHGNTLLTFVAADRFGRSVTATRSIYIP